MKIKPRMLFAHMRSAQAYAQSSYAKRLKVGCVVVDPNTDQPISIGWNGTAPGAPNVCEREVDGKLVSGGVIHAEINAMRRIHNLYDDRMDLVLFLSHSPCPDCVREIIDSGSFSQVYYSEPYRIIDGIKDLLNAGIEVFRMVDQMAVLQHCFTENNELGYTQICKNPDL